LDRLRGRAVLLDLALRRRRGAEVGDGGGHDEDVRVGGGGVDGVGQLAGGLDLDDVDGGVLGGAAGRRGGGGGAQGHPGAAAGGLAGDRGALPARGAVAEEADRVERLAGAAGADDDGAPRQVLRRDEREGGGGDRLRLGQPAGAGVGAGE